MSRIKDKPAVIRESVTLTAPHTHAGKDCIKGDQIDVTPQQKEWLIRKGKIAGATAK